MDFPYINFGNKFKTIRNDLGLTLLEFSNLLKLSEGYLSYVEKGQRIFSDKNFFGNIIPILKMKNINVSDIEDLTNIYWNDKRNYAEQKAKSQSTPQPSNTGATYNLDTDAMPVQKIPVISWVHAGQWTDVSHVSTIPNDDFDEYIYTSAKGASLFALRVTNDCMEPRFESGDIIVVNTKITPEIGDYVIAKDTENQSATFKQLKQIGDMKILHPLNPKYDDIPLNNNRFVIVGKVVRGEIS